MIKNNPYTYKVTESQIFYTKEFKEEFWRRYQAGESPRAIVEALEYDPDMLGQYRINGLQINIQKQAQRPEGFTQGKGRHKGRKAELYDVDNNPSVFENIPTIYLWRGGTIGFERRSHVGILQMR